MNVYIGFLPNQHKNDQFKRRNCDAAQGKIRTTVAGRSGSKLGTYSVFEISDSPDASHPELEWPSSPSGRILLDTHSHLY
jgi:hypothetical protein